METIYSVVMDIECPTCKSKNVELLDSYATYDEECKDDGSKNKIYQGCDYYTCQDCKEKFGALPASFTIKVPYEERHKPRMAFTCIEFHKESLF